MSEATDLFLNKKTYSVLGRRPVRHDGAAMEILTNDAERLARDLLMRDAALSGLEITGAGLEEAFLTLTAARTPAVVAGGLR